MTTRFTDAYDALFPGMQAIPVAEAIKLIPVSRSAMYDAMNRGEVPEVRIGRRRFVKAAWVREQIGGQS